MNFKVVYKFEERNKAPNKLSTPSAMFLPVQDKVSIVWELLENGGDQDLMSGSLVRI